MVLTIIVVCALEVLNILYVSTSDLRGGAARGAYRLHRGFLSSGINSRLLVGKKFSDDYTVTGPTGSVTKALAFLRPYVGKALLKVQSTSNRGEHSINVLPSGLHRVINESDADVVLLHWIGGEMISIREVGRIEKPIVWRLADQWAFAGAEHYVAPGQENRYVEGYAGRNRPDGHGGIDLDRWTWRRKARYWLDKPMTIVTGSQWLADCARASYLFRNKHIEVIPSGLDTSVYKPIAKSVARDILNLPQDKKLVLFGSLSATSDIRKGFHLLLAALRSLQTRTSASVGAVVFGASEPAKPPDLEMPVYYLARLEDDWSLALTYSAADLFVLPTMQDNLPYTIIEAMSCGLPCVSFEVGGLSEMIEHKRTGYLARPFDCEELAQGMRSILEQDSVRTEMSIQARAKVLRQYDVQVQVGRYLDLWQRIGIHTER